MATFNKREGAGKVPLKQQRAQSPDELVLPQALQRLASTRFVPQQVAHVQNLPGVYDLAQVTMPGQVAPLDPMGNGFAVTPEQSAGPTLLDPARLDVPYRQRPVPVTIPQGRLPGTYGPDAGAALQQSGLNLSRIGVGLTDANDQTKTQAEGAVKRMQGTADQASGLAGEVAGDKAAIRAGGDVYDPYTIQGKQYDDWNSQYDRERKGVESVIQRNRDKRAALQLSTSGWRVPERKVAELGQRELQTVGLIAAIGAALGADHNVVMNALNMYGQGRLQGMQAQYDAEYEKESAAFQQQVSDYQARLDALDREDRLAMQQYQMIPKPEMPGSLNQYEAKALIVAGYQEDIESGVAPPEAAKKLIRTLQTMGFDPFKTMDATFLAALNTALKGDTNAANVILGIAKTDIALAQTLIGMEEEQRDRTLEWLSDAESDVEAMKRAQIVGSKSQAAPGSPTNIEQNLQDDRGDADEVLKESKGRIEEFEKADLQTELSDLLKGRSSLQPGTGSVRVAWNTDGTAKVATVPPVFDDNRAKPAGVEGWEEARKAGKTALMKRYDELVKQAEEIVRQYNEAKKVRDDAAKRLESWRLGESGGKPRATGGVGSAAPPSARQLSGTVGDQIASLMGDDLA